MINYVDTSHKTLGLAVSETDLDVTNLSVISKKVIGNVEFGVLGASHYIKMRHGNYMITEVFACKKLEGDMKYYPITELLGRQVSTQTNAFQYDFKVELIKERKYIDALINEFEKARTEKDGETLMEAFPTKVDPPFKACTYIHFKEYETFIRVQTLHTYPEEEITVYTETKFKRK